MDDKNQYDVAPAQDGEPMRFFWIRVRDQYYSNLLYQYLGLKCYYCDIVFNHIEDLDDVVWVNDTQDLAHTKCYMEHNVQIRRFLPRNWYQDFTDGEKHACVICDKDVTNDGNMYFVIPDLTERGYWNAYLCMQHYNEWLESGGREDVDDWSEYISSFKEWAGKNIAYCSSCKTELTDENRSETMLYNGKRTYFEATCINCSDNLLDHIDAQERANKNEE